MDAGVVVAIALAVAFAFTNGFHDAANAIAALVATGAATPFQAIVLACVFNLLARSCSAPPSRTRSAGS